MLDATARRVLESVDQEAIVDLASHLIRIPSFKTEETPVARFLAEFFQRRGYEVQLQEVEPGRYQTVAVLRGTGGGKSLMFNGHIDIDPLASGWKRDPWTPSLEDGRLYGAGIYNMKAGVASMIGAAEAVRRSGVQLKGDLVIACVVGELQGGVGTVYLVEHGPRADMAVVTEPYGADTVLTTHAGWIEMALSTVGLSKHISRMEEAVDAIEMMARVIPAVKSTRFTYTPRPDLPGLPRIIVGAIIGGRGRNYDLRGPNFVSDYCTALVDIRTVPGQTVESVKADIVRTLEELRREVPDLRYEIEVPPPAHFRAQRVVMEPLDVPKDEYIVQAVARHYKEVHGRDVPTVGAVVPGSYAGNDTCHLWRAGIPCCLYGPQGGRDAPGEPDEFVPVEQMVRVARVLALTALDVCNLPK